MNKTYLKPNVPSESQRENLIELAKKYFPEYNSQWIEKYDADNVFVAMTNMCHDLFRGGEISIGGHYYHWFEFMSLVSQKIEEIDGTQNLFAIYFEGVEKKDDEHIIDFFCRIKKL